MKKIILATFLLVVVITSWVVDDKHKPFSSFIDRVAAEGRAIDNFMLTGKWSKE